MSIAHLRATRISPHLVLVALLLAAVAALALTLAPTRAAAFDTRVYFDNNNNDTAAFQAAADDGDTTGAALGAGDSATGAVTSTGSTPAAGVTGSLEIVTETGLAVAGGAVNVSFNTVRGFINSTTGPKFTNFTCTASATATHTCTLPVTVFANNDIGAGALAVDNTLGAGLAVGGTLTVLGPVGNVVLAVAVADRLLTSTLAVAGTGNVTGGITATVTDTLGAVYPNGQTVLFQSSNAAAGNFTTSATVAEVIAIAGGAGVATIAGFTGGATGGVATNITASIGGVVSNTIEIRVGGSVAALAMTIVRVVTGTNGAGAAATGAIAGGQLFALAQADANSAVGAARPDVALVRVVATDSTGGATESINVPILTDTPPVAGLVIGTGDEGAAMAAFSAVGAAPAAVNGTANGAIDGSTAVAAALGTHSFRANVVIGTTNILSNIVDVILSGPPATITAPTYVITTSQATSLAPGQTAAVSVTATDAGGRIVPDGTSLTFNVTAPAVWTNGAAAITPAAGTTNGIGTATLLPTGTAINSTVTVFSAANPTIANSSTIQMVPQAVGTVAPTSVVVTAGDATLDVGESTTVTATVTDQNGAAMANAQVRFSAGTAAALIDSAIKQTNANGQATATFTAEEPGVRTITATVVQIVGGVVVETAVSGSVEITVEGAAPPPSGGTVSLGAGGNLLAWLVGDATASDITANANVVVVWLWNGEAWEGFDPRAPGQQNFTVSFGSVVFIVTTAAGDITV